MNDSAKIMEWYMLGGVDAVCGDTPFSIVPSGAENTPRMAENSAQTEYRPATTDLAQENNAARKSAKELCEKAQTLDDLREILERFEGCSLKFSANSTVFGYGNPDADVMIIGEAPGADEDRIGEPFVGRSGQLLDKMMSSIGLKRDDCYISNVLPWRPPGNRNPTDGEIAVCLPFLQRQIELVAPKILFLLGASAANSLLDNADTVAAMRGKAMEYSTSSGNKILALCSYHPAYLLRNSAQKAKSWNDLLYLREKIEEMKLLV
ncbi:MAG: uracil-DNA glycosylase [Alphaproteobacteria bacterium]|nr:uracil-DNA glycosylase [Alphaproteobacteria bacterium]MBR3662607.1 uracil-DNA glycosylase [Alphaproteobacteria bacterium]